MCDETWTNGLLMCGYNGRMDELLRRLDTTPRTMAHLTAELRDQELDAAEAGEWSARQILAHLRDDESMVMRMRLVRMLVEDDPLLPDFDEQAWATNRNTSHDKKESLLADFMLQRQASLNLLQRLTPEQWERPGRHEVRGSMTVRDLVERWADHDDEHVRQFERATGDTLAAVLERRAHPGAESEEKR